MRWKSAALKTLTFVFVVLFASVVWASDERTGAFWVYWNNGWKIINFAILVFFLVKIAKAPLKKMLADRYSDIESDLNGAETTKQESEDEYAQVEQKMAELESTVDQLTQIIESQGNSQKERIISQAQTLAETIIEDAKNRSMYELNKARQKLKDELVDLALEKAEELIRQKITAKDQDSLAADYVNKMAAAA